MNVKRGKLFILSGPSGVGKGTLRERALSDVDGLVYSISCTTRKPRGGERDGVEYRFITLEDFESRIAKDLFLEHALVHNARYGTLREDVERELDAGHDVLLEIDVQGAKQVKQRVPEAITVFVVPPSIEELERRLRNRHTEDEAALSLRLKNARQELEQAHEYDHVLVNDKLEKACQDLRKIILNYRQA